jgi:hypothetical protein
VFYRANHRDFRKNKYLERGLNIQQVHRALKDVEDGGGDETERNIEFNP